MGSRDEAKSCPTKFTIRRCVQFVQFGLRHNRLSCLICCDLLFFQETIHRLYRALRISGGLSQEAEIYAARHRNITTVLGCLAEKLAGPKSITMLTDNVLQYLLANLVRDVSYIQMQLFFCGSFLSTFCFLYNFSQSTLWIYARN